MFFLNLTFGEFVVLFSAISAVITALYLLDRSKSSRVVSTLRFWTSDAASTPQQNRKRMREPWSFLLQLLSILLLLLAIGQLQWGKQARTQRKHVLLVDTSAWSSERLNGKTLLETEKQIAHQYLSRLPGRDEVLLASVDAFTTPATLFASDHAELGQAIEKLQPSYSALDLERALSFARRVESLSGNTGSETVYIGPARIQSPRDVLPTLRNLRTILIQPNTENCGIRSLGLRRDDQNPNAWRAVITVSNYGHQEHAVQLTSALSGRTVLSRRVDLRPQEQTTLEYGFRQAAGGQLITRLQPGDALHADDQITATIPGTGRIRLAVYTKRPNVLRPLIEADESLDAAFLNPAQYNSHPDADAILLDQMSPAAEPEIPTLWIDPPQNDSPVPVNRVEKDATIETWNTAGDFGVALGNKDVRIRSAKVFQAENTDVIPVANIAQGPVIVARPASVGRARFVVLGFDPLRGELRYQSTTPLLFVHLLRWLCPKSAQVASVTAEPIGAVNIPLSSSEQKVTSVSDENGALVPFDVHGRLLQVFSDTTSPLLVHLSDGTAIMTPVLADVAEHVWTPPKGSSTGLPRFDVAPADVDLWRWLACAGGFGLLADWLLFGRKRRVEMRRAEGMPQSRERERELVGR